MGQNASVEARHELRRPTTRLVGSVAYHPERYGRDLIDLSLEIVNGWQVSPANYTTHRLINQRTIEHLYPNDALAG